MKKIKLICIYDSLESKFKRRFFLSATTKIDYLISVLNRIGYEVELISVSEAEGGHFSISRTTSEKIGNNILTKFGCIALPLKKLTRKLSTYIVTRKFEHYIKKSISKDDIVIAYHSLRYAEFLTKLRSICNFTLIGEIEELYQDVRSLGESQNKKELEFIKNCDKYIFPSHLMDDRFNKERKKSLIVHGLYNTVPDRGIRFEDAKVHIIYAGTFDPEKGGAVAAVTAAEFLPANFHIHICGFGNDKQINEIITQIEIINKKGGASVSYEGMLKGDNFIELMQKCEIGLSTQNPDAQFNSTSFPSKILTYLSNGLKVVTIDIPAVSQSLVGQDLFYYTAQTPQSISEAIVIAHESSSYDGRELLNRLDRQFQGDFIDFLK